MKKMNLTNPPFILYWIVYWTRIKLITSNLASLIVLRADNTKA